MIDSLKKREKPLVERLVVIGPGLIGSSILRAARTAGLAHTLITTDANPDVIDRVRALGLADEVAGSIPQAVENADIVILCVPVGAMAAVAAACVDYLKPGAIISDVGSVKESILEKLAQILPSNVHLVPAHPVAGTEYSGPDAGFSTLFLNRWSIITPPEQADPDAVACISALWEGMGANVEIMTAQHHDLVLAITSHVPHLIAYNIVGTAADLEQVTQSEVIKFSAGGFRDFTRIASSDPTMWRDIFLNNKEAVLEMLSRFSEDIASLARAIRWGDGDALFELFTRTRAIRRNIIESGQETAEPDFGRQKG